MKRYEHLNFGNFFLEGIVENKVVNGCITHRNLLNSSSQTLKKAKQRRLRSLRSIR